MRVVFKIEGKKQDPDVILDLQAVATILIGDY
jgi:hypothetical protein